MLPELEYGESIANNDDQGLESGRFGNPFVKLVAFNRALNLPKEKPAFLSFYVC